MDLSRGPQKRWVVEGISQDTARRVKAIAAELGCRNADVLDAAISDLWDFFNTGDDTFPAFDVLQAKR